MKSKVVREIGGVLIIDGIKMYSPATIHCNKPSRLKANHKPERSQDGIYKQRGPEDSRSIKSL